MRERAAEELNPKMGRMGAELNQRVEGERSAMRADGRRDDRRDLELGLTEVDPADDVLVGLVGDVRRVPQLLELGRALASAQSPDLA